MEVKNTKKIEDELNRAFDELLTKMYGNPNKKTKKKAKCSKSTNTTN